MLLDRPPTESIPVGQIKQCQHLVSIVVEVMLSLKFHFNLFIAAFPLVMLHLLLATCSRDKGKQTKKRNIVFIVELLFDSSTY